MAKIKQRKISNSQNQGLLLTGNVPIFSSNQYNLVTALGRSNAPIALYQDDSSIMVVERKKEKVRVTLAETEEDVNELVGSNVLSRAVGSNDASENSYVFDLEDIKKLLNTNIDEVLSGLVTTLSYFGTSVDPNEFLKIVLELKNEFAIERVLENLKSFSHEEIKTLMNSYNVVRTYDQMCS